MAADDYPEAGSFGWDAPLKAYIDETVDEKVAPKADKSQNLSDLPDKATARTNLGLGDAAVKTVEQIAVDPLVAAAIWAGAQARERRVSVKDHGAVGNSNGTTGGTDDLAAIYDAIDAAVALGPGTTLWFPAVPIGYRITAGIDIPGTLNVLMEAPVIYSGSAVSTVKAIRYNPTGSVATDRDLVLRAGRGVLSDWLSENDIGVQIRNTEKSRIAFGATYQFCINFQLFGDNAGVVGNEITLSGLRNSKVDVDTETAGSGWVNDNNFHGGYASTDTGINPSITRYGIRIRSSVGYQNNANVFDKFICEKGTSLSGGAEAVVALVADGINNEFRNIRTEGCTVAIRTTGAADNNRMTTSYSTTTVVDDQGSYPTTMLLDSRSQHMQEPRRLVWQITDLQHRAVPYDASNINVPGMVVLGAGGTAWLNAISGMTINPDYLDVGSRHLGIFISTERCKRFVFAVDAVAGRGGRVSVRCYDAAGALMDPAAYTAAPLVRGASGRAFAPSGNASKDYITGSDSNLPCFFQVAAGVKSILVSVATGSASPQVRAIRILTPDVDVPTTWTTFPENLHDAVALAPPATGTWTVGRRIYNAAPATGQPLGWVYTTAGWKPMANLA